MLPTRGKVVRAAQPLPRARRAPELPAAASVNIPAGCIFTCTFTGWTPRMWRRSSAESCR